MSRVWETPHTPAAAQVPPRGFSSSTRAVLVTVVLSGCSMFMAANQPDKKDLELLNVGTPRALVVQEFGTPVSSREGEGCRTDVFSFVQGYSKGAKASRVVLHGAADFLTLGLWEVVGTPTEATFHGEKMYYEVTYDERDKVSAVVAIKE